MNRHPTAQLFERSAPTGFARERLLNALQRDVRSKPRADALAARPVRQVSAQDEQERRSRPRAARAWQGYRSPAQLPSWRVLGDAWRIDF